jgi:hypothetical protein
MVDIAGSHIAGSDLAVRYIPFASGNPKTFTHRPSRQERPPLDPVDGRLALSLLANWFYFGAPDHRNGSNRLRTLRKAIRSILWIE